MNLTQVGIFRKFSLTEGSMSKLLVIGSASLDTLIIAGQPVASAGGAGMYTAMAARRAGADVSMFGLRPDPLPEVLHPLKSRLSQWIGPVVEPDQLPHFTIDHHGDKAKYLDFQIGAESLMDPDDLPADLSSFDGIHVIPLGDSAVQRRFLIASRERGARFLSAGTFLGDIREKPQAVREVIEIADAFFMNEEEAVCIFGGLENAFSQPGKLLFITLGREGALVLQGHHRTQVPAFPANFVDPTGAGDTFCGAVLAGLLDGAHPVMAAHVASLLAAREIEALGPLALFQDDYSLELPLDSRTALDQIRVGEIARVLKTVPEAQSFDFTGSDFPPAGHTAAMDFFFVSTLQQFSFWEEKDGRYNRPMIAPLDGAMLKGSSYLYHSYLRPMEKEPEFFSPSHQADLLPQELLEVYRSDDGTDPMPAFDLHLQKAREYGRDMRALGLTSRDMVERANASETPLKNFLMRLDHISGYKEDPLRKKSTLLALNLNQRPESFLRIAPDETPKPVVDYHAMRSALRTGMVLVADAQLEKKIAERCLLNVDEEWAVRFAVYRAQEEVARLSGKSIGAVDWFFFNYMRRICLEMSEPLCDQCALTEVCAKRKHLFQPVIRTTFY
jgi:ribokinase